MAETPDNTPANNEASGEANGGRSFVINGMYIRDLSFESPGAPATLFMLKEKPTIDLSIDIKGQKLDGDTYEVTLEIGAKAVLPEQNVFMIELSYSGVFTLQNTPEDQVEYALLVACPEAVFPYARRVVSDVTRDGGFPPLTLEPVDFKKLYSERVANAPASETAN